MIYTHDEVELIDVLTLMEAVSKMAGSQITSRMVADCNLAILWFHQHADFSGRNGFQWVSDWSWDGPVVLEKLSARIPGSLAYSIYMSSKFTEQHVKAWIAREETWKLK